VKKLVDDVFGREAARVVDRRFAADVVGDDPNEAVADAAALIAHGPGRDPLQLDPVVIQAEPCLPAGERTMDDGWDRGQTDNASQYRWPTGGNYGQPSSIRPI